MYSRRFLTALESLDRERNRTNGSNPWLIKAEIKSLWNRRERILERAQELIAEHGEDRGPVLTRDSLIRASISVYI